MVRSLKRRSRALALLLALCLLAGLLGGCAARQTEVQYLIGVSLANLSEQWRLVLKQELESEAEKYENIRLVFSDAAGSNQKQEEDIRRLLEYGIDLLIVSPADVDQLIPVISDVYAQLPVIVLDRAVEGYDYTLFIGPDNQQIGQQAGAAVLALLDEEQSHAGVLELMAEGYASQERSEAFAEVMDAASVKVFRRALGNPTRDGAQDALLDNPELLDGVHVVFAHNDYMAYGVHLALEQLGRRDVRVVGLDGFDGEEGGLRLVQKGLIDATVTCPTGGRDAIQSAMEILTNTSGVPKKIILRSHTLSSDTVDEYLAAQQQETVASATATRVGYVQIQEENNGWRNANMQSIHKAARDFGVDLTVAEVPPVLEEQIIRMREFIEQDMDVIVLTPGVESGWDEVLQEAKDAGIPVLLSDRKVDSSIELYTSFIGADFLEEGRRCARWLMQATQGRDKVRIMEIQGSQGSSPTWERKQGFESTIAENARYDIVYSTFGNFLTSGGRQVMEDYLREHDWDIDAIYCHNDSMALGVIEVLQEHGIVPGKDVLIMSIDGTSLGLEALKKGELNCVAECNPLLGPQLMKAIIDLAAGKELPLRIITDEAVFTAETPAKDFKNRQY